MACQPCLPTECVELQEPWDGTCHKCGRALSRAASGSAPPLVCPTCKKTRFHSQDCGHRYEVAGLAPTPEVLRSCPKCSKACQCSGGPVMCHPVAVRQARLFKRSRGQETAGSGSDGGGRTPATSVVSNLLRTNEALRKDAEELRQKNEHLRAMLAAVSPEAVDALDRAAAPYAAPPLPAAPPQAAAAHAVAPAAADFGNDSVHLRQFIMSAPDMRTSTGASASTTPRHGGAAPVDQLVCDTSMFERVFIETAPGTFAGSSSNAAGSMGGSFAAPRAPADLPFQFHPGTDAFDGGELDHMRHQKMSRSLTGNRENPAAGRSAGPPFHDDFLTPFPYNPHNPT